MQRLLVPDSRFLIKSQPLLTSDDLGDLIDVLINLSMLGIQVALPWFL